MKKHRTISAKVGDRYTVSLKNFRIIPGHDDSLPYHASVVINGEVVGTITNDGWGGQSDFDCNDDCRDLCNQFNDYANGYDLYPDGSPKGLHVTLWDLCDILAHVEGAKNFGAEQIQRCMGLGRHFQVDGDKWTLIYDINDFDEQAFIERFHPDYNCDEIAWIDDIAKLLDGEAEDGDAASQSEYANLSEEELKAEMARLQRGVLERAFQHYLDIYYPITY